MVADAVSVGGDLGLCTGLAVRGAVLEGVDLALDLFEPRMSGLVRKRIRLACELLAPIAGRGGADAAPLRWLDEVREAAERPVVRVAPQKRQKTAPQGPEIAAVVPNSVFAMGGLVSARRGAVAKRKEGGVAHLVTRHEC